MPPLSLTDEQLQDLRKEALKIRLAHEFEVQRGRLATTETLGAMALRSLVLVNGGAIAGLLTFIGNAHLAYGMSEMRTAFGLFLAGLIAAVAAGLFFYFGQDAAGAIGHVRSENFLTSMFGMEAAYGDVYAGRLGWLLPAFHGRGHNDYDRQRSVLRNRRLRRSCGASLDSLTDARRPRSEGLGQDAERVLMMHRASGVDGGRVAVDGLRV